jgi:hypothetical protein
MPKERRNANAHRTVTENIAKEYTRRLGSGILAIMDARLTTLPSVTIAIGNDLN